MRNLKPILLIEDDQVDAMTVERALKDLEIANKLIHRYNGEEALEYLKNDDEEKPCLIFLDLNMPRMNGFELLKIIKADEVLKRIPVVILTTSDTDMDVVETFGLGAAGYVVKPVDYKKFVKAIDAINQYWTLSKLPDTDEYNKTIKM